MRLRRGKSSSEPSWAPEEFGGWQQGLVWGWHPVTGHNQLESRN